MKQNKPKQEKTAGEATLATENQKRSDVWLVVAIFFAALIPRVLWLDMSAFRADTLHFYQWAMQGLSAGEVWSQWSRIMENTAQFPLAATLAVGISNLLPVPPGGFSIRFSDALFGSLAVVYGSLIGRSLGGKPLMLALAALWTLNPFHLQLSREAYFYSTLVAGSTMIIWAVLQSVECRRANRAFSTSFYVALAAGLVLSAFSHFTGWIIAAFGSIAILLNLWWRCRATGRWNEMIPAIIIPAIAAIPLLFSSWAIPYFLKDIGNAEAKAESIRVMGEVKEPLHEIILNYFTSMGWGSWWPGILLLVAALLGLVMYAIRTKDKSVVALIALFIVSLSAYMLIMKARGIYAAVRHVSFLLPIYWTLIGLGLWQLCGSTGSIRKIARMSILVVALSLLAYPAWHVIRLTGNPAPYRDIKTWFDSQLPAGTPVLVDRWFEPWNELTIYPTTNVVFTFTAPNEPLDVFLSTNWREQAKRFFEQNPDAAYLEIAKSYWDEKEVGAWTWPREYFRRHAAITNSSGLVLRNLGLAYREDFYSGNTNRLVTEVFFNTREDQLAIIKDSGEKSALFFGHGFQYEKSGPMGIFRFQTQQFMDWRLLGERGELEVYNFTDAPMDVSLLISAVAPREAKVVTSNGKRFQFTAGQMQRWNPGPVTLAPGRNVITLEDPLWSRSQNPLLIQDVQIQANAGE